MNSSIALIRFIALCAFITVFSTAALPQAVDGTSGVGGIRPASTSLCGGGPVDLVAPNDMTNAAWVTANLGAPTVNNQTGPFGGTNAGSIAAANTGTSFSVFIRQSIGTIGAGNYEISGYLKSTAGNSWMLVGFGDGVSTNALNYFDFSGGVVGSASNAGIGTVYCAKIQSAGNGWFQFSLGGSFSSSFTGSFFLVFVDSNGGSTGTTGQTFNYYTVGP